MKKLTSEQIQLTKNILYSQLMEYKEANTLKGIQKDIKEVLNVLNDQQEEIRNKQYI
tara:strand:+ start:152 stop:322 length:171 start_codon:yes stop_codon:yes gene_type:complete